MSNQSKSYVTNMDWWPPQPDYTLEDLQVDLMLLGIPFRPKNGYLEVKKVKVKPWDYLHNNIDHDFVLDNKRRKPKKRLTYMKKDELIEWLKKYSRVDRTVWQK